MTAGRGPSPAGSNSSPDGPGPFSDTTDTVSATYRRRARVLAILRPSASIVNTISSVSVLVASNGLPGSSLAIVSEAIRLAASMLIDPVRSAATTSLAAHGVPR